MQDQPAEIGREPGGRCVSCPLRHMPACSGIADPSHCRPGMDARRNQASRFLSSQLGWPRRVELPEAERPRDGRLRVGFWTPVLMPIGGTETWHRTLLPRLARDPRIDVLGLAVLEMDRFDLRTADACGVPVTRGAESLRKLAARCDVLVMWGIHEAGRYLAPRGSGTRPVTVAVSHDDDGKRWFREVMEGSEREIDRFVAVDAAAVDPTPANRAADLSVIPNAVDPDRTLPTASRDSVRRSLGLTDDDVMILYLARLSEEKRPVQTVEAVCSLPDHFKLIIAGDGPDMGPLRDSVRGRADRVRILGRRGDTGNLLAAADLFVSFSRSEGFGLSAAEAMLAGVPVVATPVGFLSGRPDLARIVDPDGTAGDWADAITADWADAEGRMRRAALARETIASSYSVERHVRLWADFLTAAAG